MKITDVLLDMLVELDSEAYTKHTVFENGKKINYIILLREIYGMLVLAILFYKKFCKDSDNIAFAFSPYNPCFANRIKFVKKHTVGFHVDGVMYSNVNPKVNDNFKECMNCNDGKHGEVN